MPNKPLNLIGVHHKTGTVWMQKIFQAIARQCGYRYHNLRHGPDWTGADFVLEEHSRFPAAMLELDFRGMHIIRDPRDIVLSGMRYHLDSKEDWLREPKEELGGKTYQGTLNALPPEQRFGFELQHVGGETIEELLAWNYEDPRFLELRYEDLMADESGELFRRLLDHMGLPEEHAEAGRKVFVANSLFSGGSAPKRTGHVRDGRVRQWERQMTRAHGELFVERAGAALIRLGYETDHDWVARLEA